MQQQQYQLEQGQAARITRTGQIVTIRQISQHGMAVIKFKTGGEHIILNKYLEPVVLN